MNMHANPSLVLKSLLGAITLALAACSGAQDPDLQDQMQGDGEPPLAGADIGGDFTLTNADEVTVNWSDFAGQYRIVYFGFAYCPDICPTDMQRTVQGLEAFTAAKPELGAKVRAMFITIDPERDTPEVVGEFASAFSKDLIGLTGTPEQIADAASKFRVFYAKGEESESGGYLMDHSRIVYLFGPEGEPLATLPADEGAQAVTRELAKWVK